MTAFVGHQLKLCPFWALDWIVFGQQSRTSVRFGAAPLEEEEMSSMLIVRARRDRAERRTTQIILFANDAETAYHRFEIEAREFDRTLPCQSIDPRAVAFGEVGVPGQEPLVIQVLVINPDHTVRDLALWSTKHDLPAGDAADVFTIPVRRDS